MPKIDMTKEELSLVADAVRTAAASAARFQKSGKTPQITEVYRLHEATLKDLEARLVKAANGV